MVQQWLLTAAFLLLAASGSWGISCDCENAKCTEMDPDACPAGTTRDLCDCCTVCAGTLGETCGGPWGIYGDCGLGLECHQDPCSEDADDSECYLYYLTEPGQCVEKRRRSILDFFSHAGKAGIDEVRQRRRLRLLHELETLRK